MEIECLICKVLIILKDKIFFVWIKNQTWLKVNFNHLDLTGENPNIYLIVVNLFW